MFHRVVLVARVCALVFTVAVGIGVFLHHQGILPDLGVLETAVWVTGLLILGIDNLGTLVSRHQAEKKRERNQKLDDILMQLLVGVAKSGSVRLEELGASIWLRRRIPPIRYWWSEETVLRRIRRLRPMNYPHQSHLTWTSRMGLVGSCFSGKRRRYKDLWNLSTKYDEATLETLTQAQFERISEESRDGFKFEEFKVIAGKYSEMVATPIFSHEEVPKLLGVLSLDRGMPDLEEGARFQPALNKTRVREDLDVIVGLIGRILSKPDEGGR